MPIRLDRRRVLALVAAAPAFAAVPAWADETQVVGDIVLGADDAPVTVIEYASFTCPHCSDFHKDTFPKFREEYIETGKANFILREVYFDPPGLWASMLSRCGGRDSFYPLASALLEKQDDWARAEDVAGAIQRIGRINGLGSEQMRACLTDQEFAENLVAEYQKNAQADGIQSTPSFVINGTKHSGNMSFEEFSALVEEHL